MEAIDLLLSRRSVSQRNLIEPAPSSEELGEILSAAIRVPDHGRLSPWRLQVIRKEAQRELGAICAALFEQRNPDATERMIAREREGMQHAPVLICVTAHLNPAHKIPVVEQRLSGGALCCNLLNAAHALGYAGNWVTGWPAYDSEIKRALGHSPGVEIIGFIFLGTPDGGPIVDRARPALTDIVSEWTGSTSSAQ